MFQTWQNELCQCLLRMWLLHYPCHKHARRPLSFCICCHVATGHVRCFCVIVKCASCASEDNDEQNTECDCIKPTFVVTKLVKLVIAALHVFYWWRKSKRAVFKCNSCDCAGAKEMHNAWGKYKAFWESKRDTVTAVTAPQYAQCPLKPRVASQISEIQQISLPYSRHMEGVRKNQHQQEAEIQH